MFLYQGQLTLLEADAVAPGTHVLVHDKAVRLVVPGPLHILLGLGCGEVAAAGGLGTGVQLHLCPDRVLVGLKSYTALFQSLGRQPTPVVVVSPGAKHLVQDGVLQ
ncbi:MAG: hypothetical protein HYX97_01500 [Chloroflexi bacterium]|nr:hypothetical protein [Chloroflexota bacterium]